MLCLGLNHETTPVDLRERVAFSPKDVPEAAGAIGSLAGLDGSVVLATCNRMEIYAGVAADDCSVAEREIQEFLRGHFGLGDALGKIAFYNHRRHEAVRHLFRVASGLDSMVLGETEVFGQVKSAYATAQGAGATSKVLNQIFQQAFQVGKLIRSTTQIQKGATSVGSVAVELAEKMFGDLKRCHVMVLGAGETSRRTAMSLRSRGAESILVSNRSYDRAVELAEEMEGRAIRFDDWANEISGVDIVISSTSAPHPILLPEHVAPAIRKRRGRPLFVIDIAVPRDIDPRVGEIEGVYLYDIDVLEQIAGEAKLKRQEQIAHCDVIIDAFMTKHGTEKLLSESGDRSDLTAGEEGAPLPSA